MLCTSLASFRPPLGAVAVAALLAISCHGATDGWPGTGANLRPASGNGGSGGSMIGSGGALTGGGAESGTSPEFTCDESVAAPPSALRRLTMTQYESSLGDLVRSAVGDASLSNRVLGSLASALSELPADRREPVAQDLHGSYRRLDQTLQQIHVDAVYDVAVAAGAALTAPDVIGRVVGSCATDDDPSNDPACLEDFVRRFGPRALRRPLNADDVAFYESVYEPATTADPAADAEPEAGTNASGRESLNVRSTRENDASVPSTATGANARRCVRRATGP